MGKKNWDDVQVSMTGMEVLIFHRANVILVLWEFFLFFSPVFFWLFLFFNSYL